MKHRLDLEEDRKGPSHLGIVDLVFFILVVVFLVLAIIDFATGV